MSNQCSNLSNCRSFSFCTPFLTPLKPYATTLRPFFPLQHKLILIGRRSRSRSSSLHLTLAAQSDLVLIATTEHHDGSLVFRFGDASELVKVESETEKESSVVKVLNGDQDAQVIVKTGGRGYDSVEGRVIDVADGIGSVDVECDIAESETNAIRDLRDYHAESIERLSYISEKEVLSSQSDAKMNNSPKVAESALDEAKFSVQLDEEESSDPTVNLLDNSLDIEKGSNPEGTLLNGSDGKNVDPAVTIELESTQVSQVESMDDLDNVEEDTRKSEIDNIVPSAFPATMHISDIELTDATNEDKEEDLKDMIINESNLIDELAPSNPLDLPLIVAVNEDVEEDLQDMNINEATIIDEMASCDQLVVEPTLDEVSRLQSVHAMDQTVEHELPQVSTEIREENDVAVVMPASYTEEAERAVEEEVIQPQSIPLELKPTTQVLNIDLQDTMGQNLDDGILQVDNETNNPLIAVKLETIQLSDREVMDFTQPYTEDESRMVESKDISKGDTKDFPAPATMHISDVDIDERLQDVNISEATFIDEMPTSDPLGAEPTLEVSTTKGMDVKYVDMDERLQDMKISETTFIDERPTSDPFGAEPTVDFSSTEGIDVKDLVVEDDLQLASNDKMAENDITDVMPAEPILEEEVSQPHSTPVELKPNMQVSGINVQDATCQNTDDEILQVISEDAGNGYIEDVEQSPHQLESQPIQDEGVKHMLEQERLQDMNISEGTFMDDMPTFDPLGAEPTLEVSSTEGMDVKDQAVEDDLQLVSIDKMDENEIADVMPADLILEQVVSPPHLTPVELKATMQVSDIKVTGQNLDDEMLQVINEDTCDSYIEDVDQSAQSESQPVQAERLQDMNISEGTFMDEMPASDPLEAEPSLEVSTTEIMDVKDLAVEDELQLVSVDKMDENEIADVMPAEPILEKEVSQPHLTPVELKVTMQVSDMKVQDATCQNPDDDILQVINEDVGDSYILDVDQSPHQLDSHPFQDEGVKHNMGEQCTELDAVESSIQLNIGSHDPVLEAERTEDMVDSSEIAEASEVIALLLAAEAEVEREEIYLTDDILLSGAALLEHPFKALTGGDDAYFVAGSKWLGVASGISQWSFEGTGAGVYAQELMRTCEEIVLDTTSAPVTNPVELLCRGVKETNMSGSSNVLIANFNGQTLHVANIGDTGFLIIRHGAVFKKSSPLLHEFHFALQVEDSDDPLQLVEEHLIELEVGDIVVSATDGLFDNLYEREITVIVSKSLQAGMQPQEIANILATRAQEVGKSAFVRSPFSDAAQAAGYTGYAGGKPDNVAVIVSLVEKRSNLLAA